MTSLPSMQDTIFTHLHTVTFSETDMAGIVHFSNYFKWMETAEHALLKYLGLPLFTQNEAIFYGWPRVRASCAYHAPLRFEDRIAIRVFITDLLPRAVRYKFVFHKEDNNQTIKVATGELSTVFSEFDTQKATLKASSLGAQALACLQAYARQCSLGL